MVRNRAFRTRGGRQVRESAWIGFDNTITALGGGGSVAALILSLNATALAFRPFTIVRTRGFFGIRSD